MSLLDHAKPTDAETVRLAQSETRPEEERRFRPIRLGPVGNVVLLGVVGVAAAPFVVWRVVSGLVRKGER